MISNSYDSHFKLILTNFKESYLPKKRLLKHAILDLPKKSLVVLH